MDKNIKEKKDNIKQLSSQRDTLKDKCKELNEKFKTM